MKKSKFVKSTIILIAGGFITKLLGMLIRIIIARLINTEGMGIYMLLTPTFSLLITIAQFGFPIAISKLVAEERTRGKDLIFSIIPISLMLNLMLISALLFMGKFISFQLLHEPRCYLGIISIGFVLPFISISSILRGYFFGKEKVIPHVISNILEDIIRLATLAIGIPFFLQKGLDFAIAFIIISNIFSELSSIIFFMKCLPKNFHMKKRDLIPQRKHIHDILNISIPTTSSRIIGNIGYFFEPIILTTILMNVGYSNSFIVKEYGILNGYTLPLLMLPSFFTMAISQALIPVVSKAYSHQNLDYTKLKIQQALFFSLLIGIPITILLELFPEIPLDFIYNTKEGISYLRVLAPICLFQYVQAPIASSLQAMGKAKISFKATVLGIIIRLLFLSIFSSFKIGLWGLVIATSAGMIITTSYEAKKLYSILKV